MKWLTISQIKRRSKTAKGALKVSYEHWNQLYTATAKELREAFKNKKIRMDQRDCGLCIDYDMGCFDCPLKSCSRYNTNLYRTARDMFEDWYDCVDNADWHTWKRACKALRDKLKELMEQE